MLKMAFIPAIALAGALSVASPVTAFEQQETERVDKTATIRAGGTLRVKNFSGRVTITGSRRGDVAIHAIRRATRDRLDHIKLEVRETSSAVTIEANKKDDDWHEKDNNVVDTELDIQVPEDVRLDVDVFSSDVRVENVTGDQKLHTFSGNIDVAGTTGSVNAETFSGDIELKLGQGAGGRVDFDSFSGSLRAEAGMTTRSASRRRVTGVVGTGGNNDYQFKTFSGDVRIR
jgi:DUF4097 and DUF4098 domain-containing protein YvlB